MSKIFALLAIVLIICGVLVLALPRGEPPPSRSLVPESLAVPSFVIRVRDMAEQVQAPLSILFGIVSLYWNRRSYLRQQAASGKGTRA